MIYRARLSHATIADAIGEGDTDHAAIEAALESNPAMRQANPWEVIAVVWQVYVNAKHCVMACSLGKYREDSN